MKVSNLKTFLITLLATVTLGFAGAAAAYGDKEDDSRDDKTMERLQDSQQLQAGGGPEDDSEDSGEDKGW